MKKKLFHSGTDLLITLTRFLLVLLFVYTGTSKLIGQEKFLRVLMKSPWLSYVAMPIAYLLPAVEIVIAVLLVISKTIYTGLLLALLLLILFTGYLILMLLFSPQVPCACGGVIAALGWRAHILFNLFFIALSTFAILKYRYQEES